MNSAWVVASPPASWLFAMLGIFHGYAITEHTDGTVQASAHLPVVPCPECDQDRARAVTA